MDSGTQETHERNEGYEVTARIHHAGGTSAMKVSDENNNISKQRMPVVYHNAERTRGTLNINKIVLTLIV